MKAKFHTRSIICTILLFAFSQAYSQQENYPKYIFKDLNQIPTQRAVASISQDDEGFLWMGTNGLGLFKYNGLDYSYYRYNESDSTNLGNSLINTTYVDDENRLWVGTAKGLDLYNNESDGFVNIDLLKNDNSSNISVHAILQDKNGDLLTGTHQHGLFKIDKKNLQVSISSIEGIDEVRNLLINSIIDFDDKIIVGTDQGVFEYKSKTNSLKLLSLATLKGNEEIHSHVKTMETDDKGSVWLGTTSQGLIKIDKNENGRYRIEKYKITTKRVLSLLSTPRKTILCGTENDGLFEINTSGEIIHHYTNSKYDNSDIKSNSIWSLFLDDQERIWVGYYNNGIGVYDKFFDKFKDIESKPNDTNSLQSSSVTSIVKDDQDQLWIGMDGGGVDVYNTSTGKLVHLLNTKNPIANGLNSPDVQTLFKDSNGNIWVGTWDYGIYFLEKGSKSFKNYSVKTTDGEMKTNRVLSFSEDSKGTIWIGTFSRGIHSFDPRTNKFKSYDQSPFDQERMSYSDVRRIYVDSEDHIWIGGNEGLFKLKVNNNTYKLESLSSRFYNNIDHSYTSLVLDIYEDSSKNIWIGTDGAGLCRYDMDSDTFHWMDSDIDFDKVTVSSIIEDPSGAIWAAGNNGLAKINLEKKSVKNFTTNDGLLSNDFNNNSAFKDSDGLLYFGSYEGINYFDPQNLPIYKTEPEVYLSDLKIFNQKVIPGSKNSPLSKVISQTDDISLKHDQSVFTIDFASIDYTRPEKIEFAYYLEGFEESWNYVKNSRSATYTNLPAGNYIFKVKAANSDGIWNEDYKALGIEILKPWWFTNLAISIYVFLSILILLTSIKIINSRIQIKRAIAKERERHLQEELLNDKKIQFFTNISHEFRTPLTLILNPLNDIIKEASSPNKFKEKLKIIHRNTSRLNRLIDELLDFRKLQLNDMPLDVSEFHVKEFLNTILDHFEEEAHNRNIALSLDIEDSLANVWADKGKLEKIIFNILSNAFKSTANNGIITLKSRIKPEHNFKALDGISYPALEISIEDTGKGIEKEELSKIFKRFYQIKDRNEQYYNGTGIGLEVVKSFVDLHKGDIEVESEIDVGTKFIVILPHKEEFYEKETSIKTVDSNKTKNVQTPINPESVNKLENNKNTLLIVEDNLELRSYLHQELKSEYKIYLAEDGEKGIQQATKYVPDVIISDVIMPKMNGYEFCKQLKENLKTSHIPVLMLTAKAMSEDWIDGLKSGADVYLNKPFEMPILHSHLKQLIYNRKLLFSKYMAPFTDNEIDFDGSSLDQEFLTSIINFIKANLGDQNLNVEKLADEFNLSRSQLYRKLKALTGITTNELLRKIRLERAKELIEENKTVTIGEISYIVGFSSASYFTKCFKEFYGVSPNELNQ